MAARSSQPAAGRLLLLSTGATMFQTYDQAAKAMVLGVNAANLTAALQQHLPAGIDIDDWPIQARSGAELSFSTVFQVRAPLRAQSPDTVQPSQACAPLHNPSQLTSPSLQVRGKVLSCIDAYTGFVLATGTDTMDEFAFCLSLLLNARLRQQGRCLAVAGAMRPHDAVGYDGGSNLLDAIKVGVQRTLCVAVWVLVAGAG